MDMTQKARTRLFERIRAAYSDIAVTLPSPVPPVLPPDRYALFAQRLEELGGELIVAASLAEAAASVYARVPLTNALCYVAQKPLAEAVAAHLPIQRATYEQMAECVASITEADYIIADTATIGLRLDATQTRSCYLLPEIHIVAGRRDNMLGTLAEALLDLERRRDLPTAFVFITGPSRTADIEKTVVVPAHGPKRLLVVLL